MSAQTGDTEAAADGAAREWLTGDEIARGDLLALTHVHRYELAAALVGDGTVVDLCCGSGYGSEILARTAGTVIGVDRDPKALAEAGGRKNVETVQADAREYVAGLGVADCDAIVCFEGLEHLPDVDAVTGELVRLAAAGVLVVASVPNSEGFEEENEFHAVNFSYERARDLAARFDDALLLAQHNAEGSVILGGDAEGKEDPRGVLSPRDAPDPAWANHWLLIAGADRVTLANVLIRMRVCAAPAQNAYMRTLERANAALTATNAKLSRRNLGVHDSAAAAVIARLERRTLEAERRATELEDRLALEVEVAKHNDRLYQAARAALQRPRHRAADAVHARLTALPGGRRFASLVGRSLRRDR